MGPKDYNNSLLNMIRILMVLPEVKLFCMAVDWQGLAEAARLSLSCLTSPTQITYTENGAKHSVGRMTLKTLFQHRNPCFCAVIWSVV